MKKLIAVLLCLVNVFALLSCEKTETENNTIQKSDAQSQSTENGDAPMSKQEPSEAEIAMKMYQEVLEDKLCVVDERLGEIKLKDCRFLMQNVSVAECEILKKAVLDLDQDGVNEYVIQSEDKDHIVLRYYDGKVYSYCFDRNNLCNLNTDGSFYWNDASVSGKIIFGFDRFNFDGALLCIEEIYKIQYSSDDTIEFYMGGKQVVYEEYLEYYNHNNKTRMTFSPLDLSCEYPISSEQAWKLALAYWGVEEGAEDGAAGSTRFMRVVVAEKPSDDSLYYHILWQGEIYSHIYPGWAGGSPERVETYEEVLVDAFTGECREYVTPEPDGKG